ncbi:uncharacterized protein LOC132195765 [Neocloeon triangulifer]|uniref:uncharacterized protein LOC132195765 n=1 Tax=Neocloeon triangulifer TaxID=2078957 RepID=UPI00286F882A|nr:uncharacterized protein LOC132195765 [Neocloeon triangulifer]
MRSNPCHIFSHFGEGPTTFDRRPPNTAAATLREMLLTRTAAYSVRLSTSVSQGVLHQQAGEKVVLPSAALLAGLGLALSTFSLKQLLASHRTAAPSAN